MVWREIGMEEGIDLLEIPHTLQTINTRTNPHPFSFLFQLAKSDV